MDEIMKKIGFPIKKIKDCNYLVGINTKEEVVKAVCIIQENTKVTWSTRCTRKHESDLSRTIFKRIYACHMSTRRRKNTQKIKQKKSRNIDCPAQLIVTIRKFVEKSRAKTAVMHDQKYPCWFEFRNEHNHKIDVADILRQRPLGDEPKQAVLKLLNKGHSVSSAYHTYYMIKVEDWGPDYSKKMCDRHLFPTKNDVSTLWKMHNMKNKFEETTMSSANIVKNLAEMLSNYQKKNGTLYRISSVAENYVVVLCTPLMQRALQQVSEVVFIESSGYCNVKWHKTYFLVTQASVGCLPMACIISNSSGMDAFNEGMRCLLELIQIQPSVILTDEETMEHILAEKFFPYSKVLLSSYHALRSCWKFLNNSKHEIPKGQKQQYYQLFRDIVFADTDTALVQARHNLSIECVQPKFIQFVDKMFTHINTWCLLHRQYIILKGVETFNYNEAETMFRLFRLLVEIPLERTRLFNVLQLVDFMSSAFEKYYKNRIVEMVLCRESKVLQERYHPKKDAVDLDIEDIGNHQYVFKSSTVPEAYFQVDMITNICTCPLGHSGKLCEHQSAVILKYNIFSPLLSVEQKAAYYYVATGVHKHRNSFLPSQENGLKEEYNIICCSPETILGTEFNDSSNDAAEAIDISTAYPELERTKNKWISYCNQVIQHMERDPGKFIPAINAHLDNVTRYATSVPMLLKGLYAGFPYKGDSTVNLPPLAIISNKSIGANSLIPVRKLSTDSKINILEEPIS